MKLQSKYADVIPSENVTKFNLKCSACEDLVFDHDNTAAYNDSGEWVYAKSCTKALYDYGDGSFYKLPNLFQVDNVWYYFGHLAATIPFLVTSTVALRIYGSHSLQQPKPVVINAYGDIYNFCYRHNALGRLQKLVDKKVFKSMMGKSIGRAIKRL